MKDELYYRYEEFCFTNNRIALYCKEFLVIKHTNCGVWLEDSSKPKRKRFQPSNTYKKYSCATKEEALESFRARKKKQIEILTARLEVAKLALACDPDHPENDMLLIFGR